MNKTVNIDGKEYIIESCECCPFYDDGDGGYGSQCQYPISPSAIVRTDFNSEKIAEDCPLRDGTEENHKSKLLEYAEWWDRK